MALVHTEHWACWRAAGDSVTGAAWSSPTAAAPGESGTKFRCARVTAQVSDTIEYSSGTAFARWDCNHLHEFTLTDGTVITPHRWWDVLRAVRLATIDGRPPGAAAYARVGIRVRPTPNT